MTVLELYDKLDSMLKEDMSAGKKEVVVATSDVSIGPISHSKIKEVSIGFDWDENLYILFTNDELMKR